MITGNDDISLKVMDELALGKTISQVSSAYKISIDQAKKLSRLREKTIIQMRYGLFDGNPRTQKEIALILGISRSYVSRIEKSVLKKLNKDLNNSNINI